MGLNSSTMFTDIFDVVLSAMFPLNIGLFYPAQRLRIKLHRNMASSN